MSQPLPYAEIKFGENGKLENILNIPCDSDISYFAEVDFLYPDILTGKNKEFLFCSWK